jgi:hypothetical protein
LSSITERRGRAILKLVFGLAFLAIFASNTNSMLHWSERRGVFDDLCYLRQAHLFQRFGVAGLDTDYARDDDGFFAKALQDIQAIEPSDPNKPVCHTLLASGKRVIQYPPGTGFVLALFPEGHQVAPTFIAASAIILALALAALLLARSTRAILACGAIGCEAIYLMINPAKASYSIAPTEPLCAVLGIVTVLLVVDPRPRRALVGALIAGALVGLMVNFRITNTLLAAGFLGLFGLDVVIRRARTPFLQGVLFAIALVACTLPTLIANAINAGSPFKTTYPAQDTTPPDWSFPTAGYYFSDIQGLFGAIAFAWALWLVVAAPTAASRRAGAAVALGVALNGVYFMSHTLLTPYYMIPMITLAFATLVSDLVVRDRQAGLAGSRQGSVGLEQGA